MMDGRLWVGGVALHVLSRGGYCALEARFSLVIEVQHYIVQNSNFSSDWRTQASIEPSSPSKPAALGNKLDSTAGLSVFFYRLFYVLKYFIPDCGTFKTIHT